MKKNNSGLKLVVDNTEIRQLEDLLKKDSAALSESKSSFVREVNSFCDALDRQIEEIMNM
jgi:hypothetical protein